MEKRNLCGLSVMVGLVAIVLSIPFSVKIFTTSGRNVTVRGLCEREVKADRAIWPIVFKEGGDDIIDLASVVEYKNSIVVEWLKSNGFAAGDITVNPPQIEDLRSYDYDRRPCDYTMKSVITVCTDKVDEVVALQTEQFDLLKKGVAIITGNSWDNPVEYEYTGLNGIKPEMIEQATLNAREAAQQFAKDSGSKVGEIINATQGQFSICDRDNYTPYIKTIRVVTTVNYGLK